MIEQDDLIRANKHADDQRSLEDEDNGETNLPMTQPMSQFVDHLRSLTQKARIHEMSVATNIPRPTIEAFRYGRVRSPSIDFCDKISAYFGVAISFEQVKNGN